VLFGLFFLNTFHEEYPDEYDSIIGGRYISELKIPYRDWFQHHQPGAYALAALILPFSGTSFVRYRIILAVVFFMILAGSYEILKKRIRCNPLLFYLVLLYGIGIGATYFWGQMLLADTLSAYLILPAFALVVIKAYYDESFERQDLTIFSMFAFLTWFTSMTYTYAVVILSVYALYLYFKTGIKSKKNIRSIIVSAIINLGLPYVLFILFFTVTGSLRDYYFANFTYNQEYYIYNYPRQPGALFNPVRYAVIIAHDFINNYIPSFTGVAGLPLYDPFVITFAFSGVSFIYATIMKKKYLLAAVVLFVLTFSSARGSPNSMKETDYQIYMYVILSAFSGLFTVSVLKQSIDEEKHMTLSKISSSVVAVILSLYLISTGILLVQKMMDKFYPKYMGTMPLIYDNPEITGIVNKIVSPGDYVYIGPFAFKELFYLKTRNQPSKYHWFLQHAAVSKIKDELIADLTRNRPMVIVFSRNFAPWGGNASEFNYFMQDFLDKNYFRLYTLNLTDHNYRWTVGNTRNWNIDGDFNFDRNRQEEILDKLLKAGLIEDSGKKI
jgi:hypothetical protein